MNLIKKTIGLLTLMAISTLSFGQGNIIELSGFSGYTFRNKMPISGGEVRLEDGINWGGALTIGLGNGNGVEVLYSYQESQVNASSIYLENGRFISDASIQYLLIGPVKSFPDMSEDVQGYGSFKVGAGWVASPNNNYNEVTRFSVGGNLGLKYFMAESIGLKVGMHLYFPVTNVGASFGWSSGGGAGVGVSAWSPIVQFGFDYGLVIRLGS